MSVAPRTPLDATEATVRRLPIPGVYQKFMPVVDGPLTVQLPGELMRCVVVQVVSQDAVLVAITTAPMSKSHLFKFGDKIGARRRVINGSDVWEAQSDREFLAEHAEHARRKAAPAQKKRR